MIDPYYDIISSQYEELHGDEQRQKIAYLREVLTCTKDDILLDVGCGSGISTTGWLCSAVGIDPSEKLIAQARQNCRTISFEIAPAEQIPFPDTTFTKIISVTAIQNFYDRNRALAEMRRVATDGAEIIITCLTASTHKKEFEDCIRKTFVLEKIHEKGKETYFFCKNA